MVSMATRLGSLFFVVLGTKSKVFVLFCLFCPFLSRLSPGLDNGATSFIPLHRESDKDSCNLLTDHIKQNVKRNKKGMLINFSITVWKYRFSVTVSLGN